MMLLRRAGSAAPLCAAAVLTAASSTATQPRQCRAAAGLLRAQPWVLQRGWAPLHTTRRWMSAGAGDKGAAADEAEAAAAASTGADDSEKGGAVAAVTPEAAAAALSQAKKLSSALYDTETAQHGGFRTAIATVADSRAKRDNLYADPEFRETQLGKIPDEYSMMRGFNKDDNIEQIVVLKNPKMIPGFLVLSAITFIGGTLYMQYANEEKKYSTEYTQRQEVAAHVGTPLLGGPFKLRNTQTGKILDSEVDLKGKWPLIYFGFTNCPDICPDEMKKLGHVTSRLEEVVGDDIQPIFITVDPKRDDCEAMNDYLKDYHPRIIGLTGTQEEIDRVAKLFRVFYAVPDIETFTAEDYLVDHSIITYLMDPEGKFCEYTTKEYNKTEAYLKYKDGMSQWEHKKIGEQQRAYEDALRKGAEPADLPVVPKKRPGLSPFSFGSQ
eukprot:Rhum_TRINITY_DN9065_c0_g1::Rhum_TRINITY_DN9065_c0_g1_i1::g.31205::m.31205/K07152/SCO1_2; protein SCO1/2